MICKVKQILKGSLDSIPSPSPSVKIQIMGGKICLRGKGETLLGAVNKLLKTKSLLITPKNVLLLHLKQTFTPIILIFTDGEGDGIDNRESFKVCSTLPPSSTTLSSSKLITHITLHTNNTKVHSGFDFQVGNPNKSTILIAEIYNM